MNHTWSTLRLIEQTQHKLQTAVQFIEQFSSSSTVTYILYGGKYKKTSEYVIYVHVTLNNRHDFAAQVKTLDKKPFLERQTGKILGNLFHT